MIRRRTIPRVTRQTTFLALRLGTSPRVRQCRDLAPCFCPDFGLENNDDVALFIYPLPPSESARPPWLLRYSTFALSGNTISFPLEGPLYDQAPGRYVAALYEGPRRLVQTDFDLHCDVLLADVGSDPCEPMGTAVPIGGAGGAGDEFPSGATLWVNVLNKPVAFPPTGHAATHAVGGTDPLTPAAIGAAAAVDRGQPGGYAPLDSSGVVPAANLPPTVPTAWVNVLNKPVAFPPTGHAATHAVGGTDPLTPAAIGAAAAVDRGQPGGYAPLDSSGVVPAANLPPSVPPTAIGSTVAGATATRVPFFDTGGVLADDAGLTFSRATGAITAGGKTLTANSPTTFSQTWNNPNVAFTGYLFDVDAVDDNSFNSNESLAARFRVRGHDRLRIGNFRGGSSTSGLLVDGWKGAHIGPWAGGLFLCDTNNTQVSIGQAAGPVPWVTFTSSVTVFSALHHTRTERWVEIGGYTTHWELAPRAAGAGVLMPLRILQTPDTFASLPPASPAIAGMRTTVSDSLFSVFYDVVSDGGSLLVPVFCDGTDWRIG